MIQFECPHCQAVMRVPDAAIGQEGECPKCHAKLKVPVPPGWNESDQTGPTAGTGTQQEAPETPSSPVDLLQQMSQPEDPSAKTAEQAVGELLDVIPKSEVRHIEDDPLIRTVRRHHRSKGAFFTGLFFILIVTGGLYALYEYLNPKMQGEFTGETVANDAIPPITIPARSIKEKEAYASFLEQYGGDRILIDSLLLETTIQGTDEGLKLSIAGGSICRIVKVDLLKNEPLREAHRLSYSRWDKPRKAKINTTTAKFLEQVNESNQVLKSNRSLLEYRDRLILPSFVQGLGYRLSAVAGKKVYPCIWQDIEDMFYFAIPGNVEQFVIEERPLMNLPKLFDDDFRFVVTVKDFKQKKKISGEFSDQYEPLEITPYEESDSTGENEKGKEMEQKSDSEEMTKPKPE